MGLFLRFSREAAGAPHRCVSTVHPHSSSWVHRNLAAVVDSLASRLNCARIAFTTLLRGTTGPTFIRSIRMEGLLEPSTASPEIEDIVQIDVGQQRVPAINLPYDPLSTARREPSILVHVHPVLPRLAEASQLQLPRPGPGGQPNESSQLAKLALFYINVLQALDDDIGTVSK
jgi:hypothetical protein